MPKYRYHSRRRPYLIYRTEVGRFKNPLSRHKQRRIRRFKFYSLLFVILIIGFGYFFFYSNNFKIEAIEIIGARNIRSEDIRSIIESQINKRRFLIFKQNNLFIFDNNELRKKINEKYVLDDLKINKDFPRSIKVELKEKISLVIWVSNERYYNLDSNGIAISELINLNRPKKEELTKKKNSEKVEIEQPEPKVFDIKIDDQEFGSFPLIYDESNKDVTLGQSITKPEMISIILNLTKKIPEKINLNVNYFKIPNPESKEIKAVTLEGWGIYFDTNKDLEGQLNNLKLILDEKIKNRTNLQYIDLRFGNRVYYK